jgi:hypothetical protein
VDRVLSLTLLALAGLLTVSCGSPDTTVTSILIQTFLSQYGGRFPDPGAALSVTSIVPKFGGQNKQTWTEITGTGFQLGATVSVGGADCATIYVLTETKIDCLVQPHATGAVDVTVTLLDGTNSTLTNGFTYF